MDKPSSVSDMRSCVVFKFMPWPLDRATRYVGERSLVDLVRKTPFCANIFS